MHAFCDRTGARAGALWIAVLGVALGDGATQAAAQGATWTYTLLPGSELVDDCPVCGRPAIVRALRGTFRIQLQEENPLFSTYAVLDVAFGTDPFSPPEYRVTGQGVYRIGGEVALVQELHLEAEIEQGGNNLEAIFTNTVATVERWWPMIGITADQTNGTDLQVFQLRLLAAPFDEIWFSTVNGMTPSNPPKPGDRISGGDLVSITGRVIQRNADLVGTLGLMPPVPDLGLDAVEFGPGGEILFSLEEDTFSESLGPLGHGDLLSNQGRVVWRNADLLAAFAAQPPLPDLGLDAVQALEGGEIYFSIEGEFFSEKLGQPIRRGDLLSSWGYVVRSHEELIRRFQPPPIPTDFGLDAVHVWPSGEIWFSVEEGFQDTALGYVLPGDLLSDQGYVVYRNLDLVAAISPLEDLADFGLDALFLATDSAFPPVEPWKPPQNTAISLDPATGWLSLDWRGDGRVFRLEESASVTGPWLPASPIGPDLHFEVDTAVGGGAQSFYRLRQW